MEIDFTQIDMAKRFFRYALSKSPAEIGLRLRSESDLCDILKLGRRAVNDALAQLSEGGIVDRRRGSGTFVRKVLPFMPDLEEFWKSHLACDTSEIFTTPFNGVSQIRQLGCGNQRLHFGLWSDWAEASPAQQSRMSGMVRAIESQGHYMTMHDLIVTSHIPLTVDALREKIRQNPCDGYLVVDRWAELFLQAAGDTTVPMVFCGVQCGPYHQPSVTHASLSITSRAIQLLHEQRFEKIGIIGFADQSLPVEKQQKAYVRSMEDIDSNYRAALFSDNNWEQLTSETIDFFSRDDRPDAIYISDDRIIPFVNAAFNALGIVPGENIGLISLANKHSSIFPSPTWSKLEIDQEVVGQMAAEILIKKVSRTDQAITNILIQPTWIPGQTHINRNIH